MSEMKTLSDNKYSLPKGVFAEYVVVAIMIISI